MMTDIADPALLTRRRPDCQTGGPVVLKFQAYPSSISAARRCITGMLAGLVPPDHLDALHLAAAELLTNALDAAMRYAQVMQFGWCHYDRPIHLGVLAADRWTRLDARDPEPYMLPAAPCDDLDDHGRGLMLVRACGRIALTIAPRHKVIHAVIPVDPDTPLTAAEYAAALPAGACYEQLGVEL